MRNHDPDLYNSFHRTRLNIPPWSTTWESYWEPHFFQVYHGWHNLSEFDFLVKRALKIPGPILPIAFETGSHEPRLVFRGGDEYYELDTMRCHLVRYGGDFASADDFLARLPLLGGVTEPFTKAMDDLWYDTYVEQERLAEEAEEE